jgi:hypothetical protein
MQQHVHMVLGIPRKLESERDMTVTSPGFSVAVGVEQHIKAFGVRNPNADDADHAAQRAALVDFRQRCPQVELRMVERSRMRLVTALRNGAIDLLVALPEPAGAQCENACDLFRSTFFARLQTNNSESR